MTNTPNIRYVTTRDKTQISQINKTAPIYYNVLGEVAMPITWVIEQDGYIIGYLSYQVKASSLHIAFMGVRQELRRCGYASMLLCRLLGNALNANKTICAKVQGDDIESLLFFKSNGFKAIAILQEEMFEYYLMEWRKEGNVLFGSLR